MGFLYRKINVKYLHNFLIRKKGIKKKIIMILNYLQVIMNLQHLNNNNKKN